MMSIAGGSKSVVSGNRRREVSGRSSLQQQSRKRIEEKERIASTSPNTNAAIAQSPMTPTQNQSPMNTSPRDQSALEPKRKTTGSMKSCSRTRIPNPRTVGMQTKVQSQGRIRIRKVSQDPQR